jgi:hypothetical protein
MFQAMDAGLIEINRVDNSVRFTQSKQVITQAPSGVDALDYFVDFTFDNKEGERVYEHIREMLSPKVENHIETEAIDDLNNEELFDKGVELGIIEKKGNSNYKYQDKQIGMGRDKSILKIATNDELRKKLTLEIGAKVKMTQVV